MAEKVSCANWPVLLAQLVMQFITDLEIKGLSPAAVCHHKKMAEKVSCANWPVMVA